MPDRELVLRKRCEHGGMGAHLVGRSTPRDTSPECPGGSETVLDPEEPWPFLIVQDEYDNEVSVGGIAMIRALIDAIAVREALDALGGSDE